MSNRGHALVVATAIYAGTKDQQIVDIDDLCDKLQHAINKSVFGCDEGKADLYAQLAERLTADTKFSVACDTVEAAMNSTALYLPGGLHAQG